MKTDAEKKRYVGFDSRIRVLAVALLFGFFVLGARLWQLQIVQGSEYLAKSNSNRLRIQRLESPRGVIYGRDGDEHDVVLADNRPARDLMFVAAECAEDPAVICERLESLIGIDGDFLLDEIRRVERLRQPHRQIPIKRDVPDAALARVEEYSSLLPGVVTVIQPKRRYVYGELAGQLLGYLGEVNPNELGSESDDEETSPYRMGDLIGRGGLEGMYESVLRGLDGQMLVTRFAAGEPQLRTDAYGNIHVDGLVDSYGHDLKVESAIREPVPGQPLFVTLDLGLQQRAEELLAGAEGAIVVLNADTGEVLAMASAPAYDPNVFVEDGRGEERVAVLQSKPSRIKHRAYREHYAPGSVFKVLLAAAALEEQIIDEHTTFYCPGRFRLTPGGRPWHCWKRSGHGDVTVVEALAFSCDVFFYNVGLELGVDRIHTWSRRLGLGRRTGLDLPAEIPGLIPSREWHEERLKSVYPGEPWNQKWRPGDTVNLSIGQGAAATTPLQNAVLVASIVNDGYRVRPFLNRRSPIERSERLFSDRTIETVRKGMRLCVTKGPPAPSGTGHEAHIEGFEILGKTGSAQVVSLEHHEEYETEEEIPKEQRDHAWFVAGVTDREPRLAICILVEHGHHGSSEAAPLAKELIDFYYNRGDAEGTLLARRESVRR